MEIESIQEADEEHEVEKPEKSIQGNYTSNRMETEYVDDDEQAYDLYSIEEVFVNYMWNISAWVVALATLLMTQMLFVPILVLGLLEVKYIVQNFIRFREEVQVLEVSWKSVHFLRVLDSVSLICCYGLGVSWVLGLTQRLWYSCVSLGFTEILRIFLKPQSPNRCVSFEAIVRTKQVHSIYRWGKLLILINTCIKVDSFLSISWGVVFWPGFAAVGVSLVVSLILIFMCALNLFSKTHDANLIYSHCWLLFGLAGGSLTFFLTFSLLPPHKLKFLLIPITYLVTLLFFTYKIKKELTLAWWEFFVASTLAQNQFVGLELPLPGPSIHVRSLQNKLTNIIKRTPMVLVKLANPEIQTRSEKLQRKKVSRTLSQAIDLNLQKKSHVRSQSSNSAYDFRALKPSCKFCLNEGVKKFKECGHGELCRVCADNYLEGKSQCYVCRGEVSGFVNKFSDEMRSRAKRFSFADHNFN